MRYFLLLGVLAISSANAAVHICAAPGGGTVFQDRPCDSASASTPSQAKCSHPISTYQARIDSGAGKDEDRSCLKRLLAEQKTADLQAKKAAKDEENRKLAEERLKRIEAERIAREKAYKKLREERMERNEAERAELLAMQAKLRTAQLQTLLNEQEIAGDPSANSVVSQKAAEALCLSHTLKTYRFKDPDSIRIENSELTQLADKSGTRYVMILDINAKNGFGGYVGAKPYTCFLTPDGRRLSGVQELVE